MTESEARKNLLRWLQQMADADNEYPLVWIGDLKKEGPDYFVFEASLYSEGEAPDTDTMYVQVVKSDGSCGFLIESMTEPA